VLRFDNSTLCHQNLCDFTFAGESSQGEGRVEEDAAGTRETDANPIRTGEDQVNRIYPSRSVTSQPYLTGVSSLTLLHYLWRMLGPFSLPCAQKWP